VALEGGVLLLKVRELTGELREPARLDLRLGELAAHGTRLRDEGVDLALVRGRQLRILLHRREVGEELLGLLEERGLVGDDRTWQ
jgi:hypothetical protein